MMRGAIVREQIYRIYLDFLETAETKRRWTIFNDIPWEKLKKASKAAAFAAQAIELYCAEEMYMPDYSAEAFKLVRSNFSAAWFEARWAFEESKHGLVFREYLTRSGLLSEAEFASFETLIFQSTWRMPFATQRQMTCYGALQEGATYCAYKAQRDRAIQAGDEVLKAIFHHVGRDEAAHAGFYRAVIGVELEHDRAGTIADLARVLAEFKMPGDGLIPGYRERLRASNGGVSARMFLEDVVWPMLTTFKITRSELKLAAKRQAFSTAQLQKAPSQITEQTRI